MTCNTFALAHTSLYVYLFLQKIIGNVHDDVRQKINDITTAINEHLTQVDMFKYDHNYGCVVCVCVYVCVCVCVRVCMHVCARVHACVHMFSKCFVVNKCVLL